MIRRRFLSYALTALLTLAGIAMLVSADMDGRMVYRLALAVATLCGTGLMVLRTKVSAGAMERIRQEGYDAGYLDGLEVEATPVIPLRPVLAGGAATFEVDQSAEKLGG